MFGVGCACCAKNRERPNNTIKTRKTRTQTHTKTPSRKPAAEMNIAHDCSLGFRRTTTTRIIHANVLYVCVCVFVCTRVGDFGVMRIATPFFGTDVCVFFVCVFVFVHVGL